MTRRRSPGAVSQSWHRRRRRQGLCGLTVYVDDDIREQVVSAGLATPEEVADKRLLAERLGNILMAALFP